MNKKDPILRLAAFFIAFSVYAQDGDVIHRAMKDELQRNLKELSLQGHDKPFFIQYGLSDDQVFQASASMGALLLSAEIPMRAKTSLRILVGDYAFNDESLDNNIYSQPHNVEIPLPMDNDYDGLRRSFWLTTDQVYKDAAKKFKKNQEILKEQEKLLDEVPHRWFAKVPVSTFTATNPTVSLNKKEIEEYIRQVSSVFKEYPHITNSNVYFFFVQGYDYIVNSEGTMVKTPNMTASVSISFQFKSDNDIVSYKQIDKFARTPHGLPSQEVLKKEIVRVIDELDAASKAPAFADDYSGPVLFLGSSVADLFREKLIFSQERLFAQNNIPALKGYRYESSTTLESKIGKSLFAEGLTIKAQPKLKTFHGVDLLGSFDVDNEGVEPASEVVLVENGILKNLMNDRTLTSREQVSNGLGTGPGVLTVSFKTTSPLAELKSKLVAQAKKAGLDYALIIKETNGRSGSTDVYRVDVATGKEELYRSAQLKPLTLKDLKKIEGMSSETEVYQNRGGTGIVSFIVPNALLLNEVEVGESRVSYLHEEEYVPSPLKK